jgi:putative sugar O-methyltransferase
LHYRHFNALYSALLAAGVGKRICEFGAGLGLTAMYARRLGASDYTIFDLPLVNVIAGNYLLRALGENAVSLYREPDTPDTVRVLPFWMCTSQPERRFDVALNQDSFPEIDETLVRRYLDEIARTTTGHLISINQEARAPISGAPPHLWVSQLLSGDRRFQRIRRSPYWIREGYVEEIYRLANRG